MGHQTAQLSRTRRSWVAALAIPLLLNIGGAVALADPLVPGVTVTPVPVAPVIVVAPIATPIPAITVTVTPTLAPVPAITVTTTTTVPSTTTPVLVITTTQPITVDTTTTISATTTPLTGAVIIAAPGTSGAVPYATTIAPGGTIGAGTPSIIVGVPGVPLVTAAAAAPVDSSGTAATLTNQIAAAIIALQTKSTSGSLAVTEPVNGIAVNASGAVALCLLANAVGRTTLDPALSASLITLCEGSASTATGGAGMTAGPLATMAVDLTASLCLVASALALPSPISTAYLAGAGLDTRCGGGSGSPSTVVTNGQLTVLDLVTLAPSGAMALCLLATATAALPATADLSTACGGTTTQSPSTVTGDLTTTVTKVGTVDTGLTAALCLLAQAVAYLPASATVTTACGTTPSSVDGTVAAIAPVVGSVTTTPAVTTCLAAAALLPGALALSQTCGTGTTSSTTPGPDGTTSPTTGPGGTTFPTTTESQMWGRTSPVDEPVAALGGQANPAGGKAVLGGQAGENAALAAARAALALLGITSLPSTATAAAAASGLGAALALIALGLVLLRRRRSIQPTN